MLLDADLRLLQDVLLRQGVFRASVYWASPYRVFLTSFVSGAWTGVALTIVATAGLVLGAHRVGPQSTLYALMQHAFYVINALRARIEGWTP